MAHYNRVTLRGQIQALRKLTDGDKTVRITIAVLVVRRPDKVVGNRSGNTRKDILIVQTLDPDLIKYLEEKKASKGDFMEASGTLTTLQGFGTFFCAKCGKENRYMTSTAYVRPLSITVHELSEKHTEIVILSPLERRQGKEAVRKILEGRKHFPGEITDVKSLGEDENGFTSVQLTIRHTPSDGEVLAELARTAEVSNKVELMGNVVRKPDYNPKENEGGRVCTYQLAVDRHVFVREDDPEISTDYPWVKSLGDIADRDHAALERGSLIFIDGSLQHRDDYKVKKECLVIDGGCGYTENLVNGDTTEVVPYVNNEYLRGCNLPQKESDKEDVGFDIDLSEDEDYAPDDAFPLPKEGDEENGGEETKVGGAGNTSGNDDDDDDTLI